MCMLVTTTVNEVPRFAGPNVIEEAIHSSLTEFLLTSRPEKRVRSSNDVDVSTQQLVNVPHFDYSTVEVDFANLEGKGKAAAQIFSDYCRRSGSEFELALATLHFIAQGYGDIDSSEITVNLQGAWRYESNPESASSSSEISASPAIDIVPVGIAEEIEYSDHYDRKEYQEDWYDVPVLVIVQAQVAFEQLVTCSIATVLNMVETKIETGASDAFSFASRFLATERRWSSQSLGIVQLFGLLRRLGDIDMVGTLLHQVDPCQFQPCVAQNIDTFGWEATIFMVTSIALSMNLLS